MHRTYTLRALFLVVAGMAAPRQGVAQAASCHAPDQLSSERLGIYERFLTANESRLVAARKAYRLDAVADKDVTYVTNESICRRAAAAYDGALPEDVRRPGRSVYVWKVGERYIVEDPSPDARGGTEYTPVMVFDLSFTLLASFAT